MNTKILIKTALLRNHSGGGGYWKMESLRRSTHYSPGLSRAGVGRAEILVVVQQNPVSQSHHKNRHRCMSWSSGAASPFVWFSL